MSAEDNCEAFAQNGADRGDGQWSGFTDLYGCSVSVSGSSLDTQDAVRIHLGLTAEQCAKLEAAGLDPIEFTSSAHLCRAMAAEVRDALDSWLLVQSWRHEPAEGGTDPCGLVPSRITPGEAADYALASQRKGNDR